MKIENIEKIEVKEQSVQYFVDWLAEKNSHGLEDYALSDLVRYLLLEINNLKKEIKEQKK